MTSSSKLDSIYVWHLSINLLRANDEITHNPQCSFTCQWPVTVYLATFNVAFFYKIFFKCYKNSQEKLILKVFNNAGNSLLIVVYKRKICIISDFRMQILAKNMFCEFSCHWHLETFFFNRTAHRNI